MIDAFGGLAITSLDLSVEEGLELIVEDNAKVLSKDVVIVAMTDYDTEGIGGADTLNYVAFFLTNLGLVSHFSFISWGVNLLRGDPPMAEQAAGGGRIQSRRVALQTFGQSACKLLGPGIRLCRRRCQHL